MVATFIIGTLIVGPVAPSSAITKADQAAIDKKSDEALEEFGERVPMADALLKSAKGVLVMPALYKAGFIGAAQYGEGVLRVNGKTEDYYNLAAFSFGFQAGGEKISLVMAFNTDHALAAFRRNPGFEVGADANVTMITIGEGASFDTTKAGQPIVAFAFGHRGLMGGVSLKGAKFTKLAKE